MPEILKLQPMGQPQPKPFMTEKEYREFSAKFQREVRADLDKQREARRVSEEEAKRHFVS